MGVQAALLGAGLFCHDVYARLIREYAGRLDIRTVWSRSEASSKAFVEKHAPQAQAAHGEEGLSQVLADASIRLVIVVLPAQSALEVVQGALAAGKHVIEEKPVAAKMSEVLPALSSYRSPPTTPATGSIPLWLCAENYRYEDVFLEAAKLLASGLVGRVTKMDLIADMPMDSRNRYYASEWRRADPGMQIKETSVHFTAALRLLASAAGLGEAVQVTAVSQHAKPDLTNPDTLCGTVLFAGPASSSNSTPAPEASAEGQAGDESSGASPVPASVSISLAAAQVRWSLSVVGTEGSLEVLRGGWGGSRGAYTLHAGRLDDPEPRPPRSLGFSGTHREMGAFLNLVEVWEAGGGAGLPPTIPAEDLARASPEEGARDLALIEALLTSAAQGGAPTAVPQVPGPHMIGVRHGR